MGYTAARKIPDRWVPDDLRLLLGRLRDVHRRQGRPRGQRPRRPGSSRQQRNALSERPLGARDAARTRPRALPAAALAAAIDGRSAGSNV